MIRNIEDLRGPPKVGTWYSVPTILDRPIIPTVHKDEGLDQLHVHYDMRFVSDELKRELGCLPHDIGIEMVRRDHNWVQALPLSEQMLECTTCKTTRRIGSKEEVEPCNGSICQAGAVMGVESAKVFFYRKVMPCVREIRSPPAFLFATKTVSAVLPICRNGRLYCPHRGADVTHLQPNRLGQARCPLHGRLLDLNPAHRELPGLFG